MTDLDYQPFAPTLPPGRARALPAATVALASLLTIWPAIATAPLLPPLGLLVLLAWRLLARDALRPWVAAPLGLLDDLAGGQPLGSAVLLWSIVFLAIAIVEQRLVFRDFLQDWAIAAGAIGFCLIAGRLIATPIGAHVDTVLLVQIALTTALFPAAVRYVAWLDRKRGMA